MKVIRIDGGRSLRGSVSVGGSKNATLPLMAACLLSEGENVFYNVPHLLDIDSMCHLLGRLGAEVSMSNHVVRIRILDESQNEIPCAIAQKMRASICLLGPLVARRGFVKLPLPGGCVIGHRPIDLHLRGLEALGATLSIADGFITARANRLKGAEIDLAGPFGSSVLATANTLMAAVLTEGKTVIREAAFEPEIVDLCSFLKKNGAKISGIGTSRLEILGVQKMSTCSHRVIPDRIEMGTLMLATVATQGDVAITGVVPEHSYAVIDTIRQLGQTVIVMDSSLRVIARPSISPITVETAPYPGFPTDLQAQLMAILCLANGVSEIKENIYPERFLHVEHLCRLGGHITFSEAKASVTGHGLDCFHSARVEMSDLRAGAALIIAGLAAKGITHIENIDHLDRGYENLENKIRSLGGCIDRIRDEVVL